MDNSKFKGLFSALLTPFDKSGKIMFDSIKRLVDFNIENGIDGFYVGGSTGEGLLLTNEERKQVFKCVKEAAQNRVTLIAHVGTISTDAAIDMAKCAEELGYDAVSAVDRFITAFRRKQLSDITTILQAAQACPLLFIISRIQTDFI